MTISVIIPTYNRAEKLRKTLQAYASQSAGDQLREVLVIDDGSTDHTSAVVEECYRQAPIYRHVFQKNSGLAAARNTGIREASGDLILFGDDDIIPGEDLLAEHLAWHERYPEPSVGVLGCVDWAPEVHATPFMVWSGLFGGQFHFGLFKPGDVLDYWHAYFCNTSVKASFLRKHGFFDERFRAYGWEDVEFGYRLYQNSWRLLYNPRAVGYHNKRETFDQGLRRMKQLWWYGWPTYLETEAGQDFAKRLISQREQSASRPKKPLKRVLRPIKQASMALLRRCMDSRVEFPASIYERVWNHYCSPIIEATFQRQPKAKPDLAMEWPV